MQWHNLIPCDPVEADRAGQEILEALGLVVLRLKTENIEKNLPMALEIIRSSIRTTIEPQNKPSPLMGEGQGGDS
jgi:very-short-patch-repair endonuclease